MQFWLQRTRLSSICLAPVNLPHHSHLPKSQGCWKDTGSIQGKVEMLWGENAESSLELTEEISAKVGVKMGL